MRDSSATASKGKGLQVYLATPLRAAIGWRFENVHMMHSLPAETENTADRLKASLKKQLCHFKSLRVVKNK